MYSETNSKIIFHIDVNSAFLSWSAVNNLKINPEQVDLRTIPSIIGGNQESRHGIVLAKSIPSKIYDINTGEPVTNALRKCPSLVIEPPNHKLYTEYSHKLMAMLTNYTPDIEQLSIDECFMDFTSISHQYA
ncbi:MAG: DNA polymerase IV, partial [Lachnotalea sp.]